MHFAHASLDHGDRRAAAQWCEKALRDGSAGDNPASIEAVALVGRLRRQDGRYDDAEKTLAAAVARDPLNWEAWLELGRVRVETGHGDTAIDAFLASVDAKPNSVDSWMELAPALHRAGREEEAAVAELSLENIRALDRDAP
jgi:cytochrome c-type biogenesis protein CcmH/NrfG